MAIQKQCSCSIKNKIFCSKCSKVKMVILLKNEFKIHKYHIANSNNSANPVWYNHLSKNRKPFNVLVNAMYRRFKESPYYGMANCLNFYSTDTGQLITKIKL